MQHRSINKRNASVAQQQHQNDCSSLGNLSNQHSFPHSVDFPMPRSKRSSTGGGIVCKLCTVFIISVIPMILMINMRNVSEMSVRLTTTDRILSPNSKHHKTVIINKIHHSNHLSPKDDVRRTVIGSVHDKHSSHDSYISLRHGVVMPEQSVKREENLKVVSKHVTEGFESEIGSEDAAVGMANVVENDEMQDSSRDQKTPDHIDEDNEQDENNENDDDRELNQNPDDKDQDSISSKDMEKDGELVRMEEPEPETQKRHATSSKKRSSKPKVVQKPEIVWLASYPNSGTSYTMTLVERGSNRSSASNYGPEVTPEKGSRSIPVHADHPEGPYWEGYKNAKLQKHTIRDLPDDYVLTKTHCGGRCIKCPATDYVVRDARDFLAACQRSTFIDETGHATENSIAAHRIKKLIHLIRNPIDNTVSRFHLERKHLIRKDFDLYDKKYPYNFTGFQNWCKDIETEYSDGNEEKVIQSATIRNLMQRVPCGGEFYKFAQWHNLLLESIPYLGDDDEYEVPVLTLFYEDYESKFNETAEKIFRFLNQTVVKPLRVFRSLPNYHDHYTTQQLEYIHDLVKRVASPETWKLVHIYFDQLSKNDTFATSNDFKSVVSDS